MGQITLSLPQTGFPNSTEDVKVTNDLTLIQNVINGNLDPSNLSASGGIMRAAFRNGSGSLAAAAGDWILASPSITVTLPAPSANAMVAVTANAAVTGATPVTVVGTNIYGLGLAAASSFKLGAPVAPVILQSDGVNWIVVSGQQDTGWVTIPLGTNISGGATGGPGGASWPAPTCRVRGDQLDLRGAITTTASIPFPNALGTLPAGMRPATIAFPSAVRSAISSVAPGLVIQTTGIISAADSTLANGASYYFDGVKIPLT